MRICLAALAVFSSFPVQEAVELDDLRTISEEAHYGVLSTDGKWAVTFRTNPNGPPRFLFTLVDVASRKEALSVAADMTNYGSIAGQLRPECIAPDGAVIIPAGSGDSKDKWGGARLLICAQGKERVAVKSERPSAWYGAWSPDGKQVYFIEGGRPGDLGYAVRRFTPASGAYETLHENKARLAFHLRISADGKKLAFYDFPAKDDEIRVVVVSTEDKKTIESEPFRLDRATDIGIGSIAWNGMVVIHARSPREGKRTEPWMFDVAGNKSKPFFAGDTSMFIYGPAGGDRWFASENQGFFVVDAKGGRSPLPKDMVGYSAAGDLWLMRNKEDFKLYLARPKWTSK